jgi:TolB protein
MPDFKVREAIQITDGRSVALRPQWNVDGQSIIFERKTSDGSMLCSLRLGNTVKSEPESLEICNNGARKVQGRAAFFSRDEFAFVSDRLGQPAIWLADLKRRFVEPLTQPAADEADYGPATLPEADGHFAFFRIIGSGRPHLYVGRLREAIQPLTISKAYGDQPWFLPGTSRLVFHSRRTGDDGVFQQEAAQGAPAFRLGVEDERTSFVTPFPSPNGSHIVFASAASGSSQIWVMRADGSNRQQLTFAPTPACFPAWSPMGRAIVFVRGDPQAERPTGSLWRMVLDAC